MGKEPPKTKKQLEEEASNLLFYLRKEKRRG
jgi:hypothetical protein